MLGDEVDVRTSELHVILGLLRFLPFAMRMPLVEH